ncbi:MAG: 3-deoxy-D-manno-octulosonic acid transferase [Verrucomicrobiota bacterium]
MIWLYRLLFPFALIVGLPFYLKRILKRGGYGERFADRLGFPPSFNRKEGGRVVWIQAVSVGEILAIQPVIKLLKERNQNLQVVLTTTTSTGFAIAREKNIGADFLAYFPVDLWPVSAKVWKRFRPDLCILMEGELWPEHLHQAKKRGVPVYLINARLSDRSFRRYQKAGSLGRFPFRGVTKVCAGSKEDAERFDELLEGTIPVEVFGNLKFDVDVIELPNPEKRLSELRELGLVSELSVKPPLILLGSSTWPGEATPLVKAYQVLASRGLDLRLVIVPRHAEKRAGVIAEIENLGLSASVRSVDGPCKSGDRVYLADTTGELQSFTALSDLVFVGKSLPPSDGGQTPIEAAALGKPIVYGPQMTNFKAACSGLEKRGGALRAEDEGEVETTLVELALNPEKRASMSAASLAWHRENRGSVERTANLILKQLGAIN